MAKKLQILRGTTAQNDAYTGSVGELTMDTEKVEVRIHDGTTQGGKPIGSGSGASLPILTHVFSDHKLNDISWLNADTFSWQSGDVYEAAYNHLAEDCKVYAWQYAPTQGGDIGYTTTETPAVGGVLMVDSNACAITEVGSDYVVAEHYKTGETRTYQRVADSDSTAFVAGVLSTDTVDDITVTFYRAEDGHKICLADQEANVQRLYDWMGVAWYYVLDTANKQFKLPRTKHAFTGLRDAVGDYVPAGLPNIAGSMYFADNICRNTDESAIVSAADGAFSVATAYGNVVTNAADKVSAQTTQRRVLLNASRSSSVYGNSNTVQPEATQMYLYFYVGNFEREAIEQTAGITSEQLNNKADIELFNAIYPVGSIYIGTQSVCPMAIAIPNSTWELLEAGRALWTGNGSNGNTKIAAGLPNITGGGVYAFMGQKSGATKDIPKAVNGLATGSSWVEGVGTGTFDASDSNSVYGNSTTVQPPAYVVNVWRRTA